MVNHLWKNSTNVKGELDALVYRSNLLGFDRSVCNYGGGNTSVKTKELDFNGKEVDVIWVKGSGADLADAQQKHFTALRMQDITLLKERETMSDEQMVNYLTNCKMDHSHPRFSIETLLHAFLPFKHVDHTHPDSIISICCADNGEEVATELFGDRYVWVPYIRPGFDLSKMIWEKVAANRNAEFVLMEKHGLVTWGESAKECYDQTIAVIQKAEIFLERETSSHPFGDVVVNSISDDERNEMLQAILPVVRGCVKENKRNLIVTHDESEEVLDFVNRERAPLLSQIGAACLITLSIQRGHHCLSNGILQQKRCRN